MTSFFPSRKTCPTKPNVQLIFRAHANFAAARLRYNYSMRLFHIFTNRVCRGLPCALLLASIALLSSCKSAPKADTEETNQMAMWLDSVPQLKTLGISNAEVNELRKAHEAGLTDPSSVELIKLARDRHIPFTDGQSVADLLNAGSTEATVVQLARMNSLGIWSGEACAMRLAGLSDKIILAVAQRRTQGLPVLSGEKLGELKNTGASDATILDFVQRGLSEKMVDDYVAQRNRMGGHGFVYQRHSRKNG
jgi:hypothetical protein